MKTVLLLTLCLATGSTVLRAEDPPKPSADQTPPAPAPAAAPEFKIAPAPSTLSPAQQQVNAALPKYDPNAAERLKPTSNAPSADAIELPKVTVTQKKRPRLTPEIVITNKGLEDKISPMDTKLLNNFTLPAWLGGKTAAERAREEQKLKEKQAFTKDVNELAKAVEVTDPDQAKAMRDAVNKP